MPRWILTAENEIMLRHRFDSITRILWDCSDSSIQIMTLFFLSDHHLWRIPPDGLFSRAVNPQFYPSLSLAAEEIVNSKLVAGWILPTEWDWSQNEEFWEEISFRISSSVSLLTTLISPCTSGRIWFSKSFTVCNWKVLVQHSIQSHTDGRNIIILSLSAKI